MRFFLSDSSTWTLYASMPIHIDAENHITNILHILPKGGQNVWKRGENPWMNQMIWPIPTFKALILEQKTTVQIKK